jgi:NADP-dependent aldehyde dehydrogenase
VRREGERVHRTEVPLEKPELVIEDVVVKGCVEVALLGGRGGYRHGILAARGAELAATLAGSISLGCGQFCTSPGVIVLLKDAASDAFVAQLQSALAAQKPHAMLTPAMRIAFDAGVAHMIKAGVTTLLHEDGSTEAPRPFLAEVSAREFIAKTALHDEVFGPSSLIVRAAHVAEALDV